MVNIHSAAADLVLPVGVSIAAGATAFGAFLARRELVVAVMATAARTTDLVPATGWFGISFARKPFGTSYAPQSRGSTG